jgi:dTDP-4-amino-4,6-dideoxygalactose transaminase
MKRFITNSPGLSPGFLRPVKKNGALPRWFPAGRSVIVPCARNALYLGWKALNLPRGSAVLLPAFTCNTVSEPLEKAGANLILFNMFRDGSIDWDHVKSLLGKNVRALLAYHYLGVPHRFEEAVSFCKEHGLFLIEDCAHALFSQWKGRHVGTTGDLAVFSIRKTIPVNYAAALVINNRKFRLPNYRPNAGFNRAHLEHLQENENHHLRLFLQSLDTSREISHKTFMQRLHAMEPFYSDPARLYPMDPLSLQVMLNADPDRIREKRRRNFSVYLRHLRQIAFFRILPKDACPLAFPFFVKGNRDALKLKLEKAGIEPARYWPGYLLPPGAYRRFADAAWLADHTLSVPCHQEMSGEDVSYVCGKIRELI